MSYGLPWVDYAHDRIRDTALPPGVELGELVCVACPAYDPGLHGSGEVVFRLSAEHLWAGEVVPTGGGYRIDREVITSRRNKDGSLPDSPCHWARGGLLNEWMDLS